MSTTLEGLARRQIGYGYYRTDTGVSVRCPLCRANVLVPGVSERVRYYEVRGMLANALIQHMGDEGCAE